MTVSIGYRNDIQGLRAIAVVLVIFSHVGIPWFAGGFVGVDVFFVLSGFLITSLLLQEHRSSGRLAIGAFYLRRLRRLLPTLLVVIVATAGVVGWLLPSADGRLILASLPFAATWTSNLFFVLREQDYFNELAEKDVFLHTWSLGVEEQFYLLWPLLLILLMGLAAIARGFPLKRGLLLLVILSYVISVTWTYWQPLSAFYMMPARIWQFGLGGLVYLYANSWQLAGNFGLARMPQILLPLGVGLIFAAAMFLDSQTQYPGFLALIPSVGAAMVILAGSLSQGELMRGTKLTHPVLVWLGDRSYSLYLWHWPVIILLGLMGLEVGPGQRGLWLALLSTLLLAMFSYRWVELPFWKKSLCTLPPKTFLLGSSAALLLVFATSFHIGRVPPRIAMSQVEVASAIRADLPVIYQMHCDAWYQHAKVEPCVFGPADAPNTALLLADSIGAQWFSAWAQIFEPPEWRLVVLTKSACAMVDEDYFYPRIGKVYDVCRQWREAVLEKIDSFKPNVIIVGSAATYDFSPTQWVEGSKRTLARMSAVAERVIVISGTPVLGFDGPGCIAKNLQVDNKLIAEDCISGQRDEKTDRVALYLAEAANALPNVHVFNPLSLVCPDGLCRAVTAKGVPVFRDSQHLTDTFVRSTAEHLKGLLHAE